MGHWFPRWVDAGAALAARVKEEMDWARGMETEGLGAPRYEQLGMKTLETRQSKCV
jgi:hypothetical protein